MKTFQLVISTIIYFMCCQVILNSAGITLTEILQNIEILTFIILGIIFVPILISILFLFLNRRQNSKDVYILTLSLFSLGLIVLNYKISNLRGFNDSITIVSNWESGMPKEIKFNEYSNPENLVTISYHNNGNISKRVEFVNGIKSGQEITFNQDGSYKKIKEFVNGNLISEYEYEDLDLKLSEELPKILKNIDTPDLQSFNDQFSIISNIYSPCRPQKYILTLYHENGKMRSKEKYINDITHGESIEFYLNGNIKEKGIRSDYGKIGKWEYFNEKGKLIQIELFDKKGILIEKKILRK